MLVFAEQSGARVRYVVRHVFERMLGMPITWAASLEEFRSATGPKLWYGNGSQPGAFHVPESGWLREEGVPNTVVPATGKGELFRTFPVDEGHDVFASVFHLLSLADEIRATEKDKHDRVVPDALLVVKHGAERIPVVDRWVLRMADGLRAMFPDLPAPTRSFKHVLTVDVDNGLKYAGRPIHRAIGASAKDLLKGGVGEFSQRWKVRSGIEKDPYAILPQRLGDVSDKLDRAVVFFLMRGNGKFDHAANTDHPGFRDLVRATSLLAEIGVHPSYGSSHAKDLAVEERSLLQNILKTSITRSRQHFLRWDLPRTLRELVDMGITEDHSIGFTDRSGFRAGTCTPFPWYDLERDEETSLVLWPFAAMDSAIHEQMELPKDQAAAEFKAMVDAVKAVNGTFVSVWHDRYLSGHGTFKGWPEVMREVVNCARP